MLLLLLLLLLLLDAGAGAGAGAAATPTPNQTNHDPPRLGSILISIGKFVKFVTCTAPLIAQAPHGVVGALPSK
jgi:hypothetical protein